VEPPAGDIVPILAPLFWIIAVVVKLVVNPSSWYEDLSMALYSQTKEKHDLRKKHQEQQLILFKGYPRIAQLCFSFQQKF
jgi:hypothetical protein